MYSFNYNQQDATLYNTLYYCQSSTCFRQFLRPSSGAKTCTHSIRYMPSLLAATASAGEFQLTHVELAFERKYWVVWEFRSEIMSADQYHLGHCFPALTELRRKRRFHNRNKVSTFLHLHSAVCMRGSVLKTFQKKETLEIDVFTMTMILLILLSLCINLWPLHTSHSVLPICDVSCFQ